MTFRTLITRALRTIAVVGVDRTPTANEISDAIDAIGVILDGWTAEALMPFDSVRQKISLTANKTQYTIVDGAAADADGICKSQTPNAGGVQSLTINGDGTDSVTVASSVATMDVPRHAAVVCAGNESARTFTITGTNTYGDALVETITGVNIGTAYGKEQFKTVTAVTVDSNTAGAITVGSDTVVDIRRPHNIVSGFIRDASGDDYPVYPIARERFNEYTDKDVTSAAATDVISFYYDRSYPSGEVSIYKTPSVSTFTLWLDCRLPFEKPTTSTLDTAINLPGEYVVALQWNLALELIPEYGKIMENLQYVVERARDSKEIIKMSTAHAPKQTSLEAPFSTAMGQPAINKT